MAIQIGIPLNMTDPTMGMFLQEILRRAPDATVVPLFVDQTNQRVLIGTTSASASTQGKLEVYGDIKVTSAASGLVLPFNGKYCRMTLDDVGGVPTPRFHPI